MKRTLTFILVATMVICLLLSLAGCGRQSSNPEQYTSSPNSVVEETNTEPKKVLGIIVNDEIKDFSESDARSVCNDLGLSFVDFDEWHFDTAILTTSDKTARDLLLDYACTDLIFVSTDFADVADTIRKQFPNTNIYVMETGLLIKAKKIAALSSMIVSKSKAQSVGGFYILTSEKYIDIGKQDREALLKHCPTYGDWYKRVYNSVIQLRDFQIPSFMSGDTMVAFSSSGVPTLELHKVGDSHYTIGIFKTTTLSSRQFADIDDMNLPDDWAAFLAVNSTDNISVYPIDMLINGESLSNKLVEGFVPLNEGENVKLSWYKGTEYHEKTKKANYRYFIIDADSISIKGELGTNGYATYDLSNIPDGLYWINYCGLIEINHN